MHDPNFEDLDEEGGAAQFAGWWQDSIPAEALPNCKCMVATTADVTLETLLDLHFGETQPWELMEDASNQYGLPNEW